MTDHILIDQKALNPEINYFDGLRMAGFEPNQSVNSFCNIRPDESVPQCLDHLQILLHEVTFEPPDDSAELQVGSNPDHVASVGRRERLVLCHESPQCYVYCEGCWKRICLPENKLDLSALNVQIGGRIEKSQAIFSAAWQLSELLDLNPCLAAEGCHLIKVYIPVAYPGQTVPSCYVELASVLLHAHSQAGVRAGAKSYSSKNLFADQQDILFAEAPPEKSNLRPKEKLSGLVKTALNQTPVITPSHCQTALQLFVCDIDDSTFYTSNLTKEKMLVQLLDKPSAPIPETIELIRSQAGQQVIPVYLTGMPPIAIDIVRRALFEYEIPGLIISFRPSYRAIPNYSAKTHGRHREYGSVAFKSCVMRSLAAVSHITGALGDQFTDCHAYVSAGLLPETIWMVCREGLFKASVLADSAP